MRSVGVELFYADEQTDRHDEPNSRFSQFCERVQKKATISPNCYTQNILL